MIDTKNNRLLEIQQTGASGSDWNGVKLEREIYFKDGNPTKVEGTRMTTESKDYTFHF